MASPTKLKLKSTAVAASKSRKRTKDAGVRMIGGRIYDSERGKTCHQCRQKTMDFVASCKQMKRGTLCPIRFCHKCLMNRYGEKAEEVEALEGWVCPKCRGICNCSFCMKRRGQQPTGILIRTARATGYSSVTELLCKSASEGSDIVNMSGVAVEKRPAKGVRKEGNDKHLTVIGGQKKEKDDVQLKEGNFLASKIEKERLGNDDKVKVSPAKHTCDKERKPDVTRAKISKQRKTMKLSIDGSEKKSSADEDDNEKFKPSQRLGRPRKNGIISSAELEEKAIVLPQGIPLRIVADVEWPADDIGPALQFLEFCSAFSRVLDLKKGQPEAILREVAKGRARRRASPSLIVQFNMKLLSLIQEDKGEMFLSHFPDDARSWWHDLGKCITDSQFAFKELPYGSSFEYDNLSSSKKLRILNFLCDEALGTENLRSWIDEENLKILEKKKEVKEKLIAVKKKENDLKQKMKDEMAKAMLSSAGVPVSVSEHKDLVYKIKTATERAHAELLESMEIVPEKKQRQDALRTEPLCSDQNGRVFWRLGGCGSSDAFLQEIHSQEMVQSQDKWFTFDKANEQEVDKHITSLRQHQRQRKNSRRASLDAERGDNVKK